MDQHRIKEIGVVHLVRAQNGVEPFKRFLQSYAENRGGIDHELVIVYKGFSNKKDATAYEKLLEFYPHSSTFVRDIGFDIKPYFTVAKRFNHRYFCFLNSFAVILDNDWLRKMYSCIYRADVGLVGATGSYQSIYTDTVQQFAGKQERPFCKKALCFLFDTWYLQRMRTLFDPFPNYHIRTNAFMISRDTIRDVSCNFIRTKFDAYKFESSKNSLTKQVLAMNMKVLVVGRDGICYEKEDWGRSNTFWQKDQGNLLIADKQTNMYANFALDGKMKLSHHAWGESAQAL